MRRIPPSLVFLQLSHIVCIPFYTICDLVWDTKYRGIDIDLGHEIIY